MALTSGTKLGPYEITGAVGAGGMGEVYRARDTRLGRDVAIKVLPEAFAKDAVLKERFEREAKTISSLNHPNICTLHDVGRQDGTDYLVMELLEGESLAQRLAKGALPVAETLRIGMEMADALERAHRQGVVHRDLKPGNIVLTKSGAKLLDFGLAKPATTAPAETALTAMTASKPLTAQGMIVGTFQYMAPEQLEGKEADARSDIFALGAVLYEMVTGKPPFTGKTQASVIAAILASEPRPIHEVAPLSPPALEHVVRRCLVKEPDERWRNAGDIAAELKWISESGSQTGLPTTLSIRRRSRQRLAGLAMVVLGAGLGALGVFLAWRERILMPTSEPVVRFALTLPATEPLDVTAGTSLAFSPDGTRLIYAGQHGGTTRLYLRNLNEFEARPMPGTEGAALPFFSPDGQWVGFFANGKLNKVPTTGGPVIPLCDALENEGATWAPDGTIYFNHHWTEGLFRVSSGGGRAELVTTPDPKRGEQSHLWPEMLPDGKSVLFTSQKGANADDSEVAVLSLATGQWRTLVQGGTSPHYVPGGHLIYAHASAIMAAPFNLAKLEVTGPSVPVIENVIVDPGSGDAQVAVARTGAIAYVSGKAVGGENSLVMVDRSGQEHVLSETTREYEDLDASPDGRYVAMTIRGPVWNIWLYDTLRHTLTRLTFEGDNRDPIWDADSRHVIYTSFREGRFSLYRKAIDGSALEQKLASFESEPFAYSTSPDGKWLAFSRRSAATGHDVWLLPMEGGPAKAVLRSTANEWMPAISPDGKWLAYESDESGHGEIYVQALSGGGGKWQVSTEGGRRPIWVRNGRELFYRSGDRLMAVGVSTQQGFSADTPKVLFAGRYVHAGHDYGVTPDGQHFFFLKAPEAQSGPTQFNVVLNWAADLKK